MSASRRAWTLEGTAFREGAQVSAMDRGFRYGMSVFETLAVWRERILFLDEHLARLSQACVAAGFDFPRNMEIALRGLPSLSEGVLRLYVTAGEGTMLEPFAVQTYALFEEMPFPVHDGIRIVLSRAPVEAVLGGHKTGNYWTRIQALVEARRDHADEALVFNAQGALVSAAMANVFLVSDGIVRTPVLEMGARDGVIRAWVKDRLPVEEALLSVEDVENADECFLTNSRLGVMPVSEISGRRLPVRLISDRLAAQYREEVLAS